MNWRSGCKASSDVKAGDVISVAGKVGACERIRMSWLPAGSIEAVWQCRPPAAVSGGRLLLALMQLLLCIAGAFQSISLTQTALPPSLFWVAGAPRGAGRLHDEEGQVLGADGPLPVTRPSSYDSAVRCTRPSSSYDIVQQRSLCM